MRILTTPTSTATQQTITTPAFFVAIGFSTVLRLSSRGDQSWAGYTWTGGRLGKVSVQGDTGFIEFINRDLAYSALVLGEGVADRSVQVWQFYGDNPADLDPVAVFDGVGDEADIGADRVRIALVGQRSDTLSSPRRFIGPQTGFNHLTPAGKKITWGGQTYELKRDS